MILSLLTISIVSIKGQLVGILRDLQCNLFCGKMEYGIVICKFVTVKN